MKRMKLKYNLSSLCIAILSVFSSCSNDHILTQDNQVKINGETFKFTINEEKYKEGKPLSRSGKNSIQKDTIVLNNGLTVEMSIEPDEETPQLHATTRAGNPLSDGHYTIYIVDEATGTRLTDTKYNLSGTINSGTFVPDHNTNINLEVGKEYRFICFNDAVIDNGSTLGLSVNPDAKNPMMGVTVNTITGNKDEVSFEMKHLAARIRTEVTTHTAYGKELKITYLSNTPGVTTTTGKQTLQYTYKGEYDQYNSSGDPTIGNSTIANVGNLSYDSISKPFLQKSDYFYEAIGDITGGKSFSCKLTGKIYGKTIDITKNSSNNIFRNHSYVVKLNFITQDPLYLYQDGTIGYFGDKDTRTPIGIVIEEKSTTKKGTAVALKDAGKAAAHIGSLGYRIPFKDFYFTNPGHPRNFWNVERDGYNYTHTTSEYMTEDSYGYHYTPPAELPVELMINGDYALPATRMAAHYSPGVSVTGKNVGKWFLATPSQWKQLFMHLAKVPEASFNLTVDGYNAPDASQYENDPTRYQTDKSSYDPYAVSWDANKVQNMFTQAGGAQPTELYVAAGSELRAMTFYPLLKPTQIILLQSGLISGFIPSSPSVRSFVHF